MCKSPRKTIQYLSLFALESFHQWDNFVTGLGLGYREGIACNYEYFEFERF
jgi:hypothetical protein